jgi:hypothetical protein
MTDKKKAKTSKPGYDSFMKKKEKGKKRLLKSLKKKKTSIDQLNKDLDKNVGSDAGYYAIEGQPPGTTRRQYVNKNMNKYPNMHGEAEAVDEYYGKGTAKKLLRTRREKAYDSMAGKRGGGTVGRGMGVALKGGGSVTRR